MPPSEREDTLRSLGITIACVAISLISYVHFRWTIKAPRTSKRATAFRLVLAFFMPTLPTAEVIISVYRTLILILSNEESSVRAVVGEWRRYLCSAAGMYIVADPSTTEAEDENENAAAAPADRKTIKLVSIQDSSDLRFHKRPWSLQVFLRISAVILALSATIGLTVAFTTWIWHPWVYRSFEGRSRTAIVGTATCTVSTILVLISRSEWSLVHLTNSAPKEEQSYRMFAGEIILAGILNEVVVLHAWYYGMPGYPVFILYGVYFMFAGHITFTLLFAFLVWLCRDDIARRSKINWSLLLNIVLALLSAWVLCDLFFILIWDIDNYIRYY